MRVLEFSLNQLSLGVFRLDFFRPFSHALLQAGVQSLNFFGPFSHPPLQGNVERANFSFRPSALGHVHH